MELNDLAGYQVGLNHTEIQEAVVYYLEAKGHPLASTTVGECDLDSVEYSSVEESLFLVFSKWSGPDDDPED